MSKTWEIGFAPVPFAAVAAGKKTIEGRLNRGKFAQFAVGDTIAIRADEYDDGVLQDGAPDAARVEIVAIRHYKTFADMLDTEGYERVIPDADDARAAVSAYDLYYSQPEQARYGVLAIEIRRIPPLIIIRGNSGSGKTTIAKRLQRELGRGTMLIQQDVVRREILRVKETPDNPSDQLMLQMAQFGEQKDYAVIIEGILSAKKHAAWLHELVRSWRGHCHVYYFDIPFEETLKRHVTKPNAHEFGEAEMREWWKEHDTLGVDRERVIMQEQSADEIIRMMCDEIAWRGIQE